MSQMQRRKGLLIKNEKAQRLIDSFWVFLLHKNQEALESENIGIAI